MSVTFSELLQDEQLGVKTRRDVRRLYDAAKLAVSEKRLTLEGHSLPTTLNRWIAQVEGKTELPKREVDVVDFSFAEDDKLSRWKADLSPEPPLRKRVMSAAAKDLLESLKALEQANSESLAMTNGKKDDVLMALSDLQGAVYSFLESYDQAQEGLRLPERGLELSQVQVRQSRKKKANKG